MLASLESGANGERAQKAKATITTTERATITTTTTTTTIPPILGRDPLGKDTRKGMGKGMGKDTGKDTGKDMGKDTGKDMVEVARFTSMTMISEEIDMFDHF